MAFDGQRPDLLLSALRYSGDFGEPFGLIAEVMRLALSSLQALHLPHPTSSCVTRWHRRLPA